jgi:hypothetical protein
MNEAILQILRRPVERAVRQLVVSTDRRRKMREELLAHLITVYESERIQGLSEVVAAERAVERFGDPQALRAELQATVSWSHRQLAHLDNLIVGPPGVAPWRHGLRGAGMIFTILGAVWLAIMVLAQFKPRMGDLGELSSNFLAFAIAGSVTAFLVTWATDTASRSDGSIRIVVYAGMMGVTGVTIFAFASGLTWMFQGAGESWAQRGTILLSPVISGCIAHAIARERAQDAPWRAIDD